jgi:hypothetical protein
MNVHAPLFFTRHPGYGYQITRIARSCATKDGDKIDRVRQREGCEVENEAESSRLRLGAQLLGRRLGGVIACVAGVVCTYCVRV